MQIKTCIVYIYVYDSPIRRYTSGSWRCLTGIFSLQLCSGEKKEEFMERTILPFLPPILGGLDTEKKCSCVCVEHLLCANLNIRQHAFDFRIAKKLTSREQRRKMTMISDNNVPRILTYTKV